MKDRITELEMRFMQQECTIQELNETVIRQEQCLTRLERQVNLLVAQFRSLEPAAGPGQETQERPPHY